MPTITVNAYAKINLGLDVCARRADGYHEVRMLMQTVGLFDTVEMRTRDDDRIVLTVAASEAVTPGLDVTVVPTDARNLCVKAAQALFVETGIRTGIDLRLTKRIPAEAGLAGGSTDAAAVLRGLNEMCKLGLSKERLAAIGERLGADIPYCIYGGTMLAEGIGERLTPIVPPLDGVPVLLVKPDFGVSTRDVYEALDRTPGVHPPIDALIAAVRGQDRAAVYAAVGNILEAVTVPRHPQLETIRTTLRQQGARAVCMSGSGPTVFGLFDRDDAVEAAAQACRAKYPTYFTAATRTVTPPA